MRNHLILLTIILIILTALFTPITYLLFPGWELLPLVVATLIFFLGSIANLNDAVEVISKIFPNAANWGFEKRYRKQIIPMHQNFDVKGVNTKGTYPLPLLKIFVDVQIEFETPHEATNDPLYFSKDSKEELFTIWQILRLPKIQETNFDLPPKKWTKRKGIIHFFGGKHDKKKKNLHRRIQTGRR